MDLKKNNLLTRSQLRSQLPSHSQKTSFMSNLHHRHTDRRSRMISKKKSSPELGNKPEPPVVKQEMGNIGKDVTELLSHQETSKAWEKKPKSYIIFKDLLKSIFFFFPLFESGIIGRQ